MSSDSPSPSTSKSGPPQETPRGEGSETKKDEGSFFFVFWNCDSNVSHISHTILTLRFLPILRRGWHCDDVRCSRGGGRKGGGRRRGPRPRRPQELQLHDWRYFIGTERRGKGWSKDASCYFLSFVWLKIATGFLLGGENSRDQIASLWLEGLWWCTVNLGRFQMQASIWLLVLGLLLV